jgi:hypothetical protein
MSSRLIGSTIPTIITAFVGFVMIAEYVLNIPVLNTLGGDLQRWGVVIGGFAIGLGVFNLTIHHSKVISRREEGMWLPSILLLGSMYLMIIFGVTTVYGGASEGFDFMYTYLQAPLVVTTKSLLAFFIASAAYRAFRARSFEAALMLISAFFVMFFMVPLGTFLGPVPFVGQWLRDVPMNAAFRTLKIGAVVGLISLGIRTLIGRGGSIARLMKPEEGEG